MSKLPAAATTGKCYGWCWYECVGGPYDGLVIESELEGRNVILMDDIAPAQEYLDTRTVDLSPVVLKLKDAASNLPTFPGVIKIQYSGWLTQHQLSHAMNIAGISQ